jgi:hypothetical protein
MPFSSKKEYAVRTRPKDLVHRHATIDESMDVRNKHITTPARRRVRHGCRSPCRIGILRRVGFMV